jgi:hypothetical protein
MGLEPVVAVTRMQLDEPTKAPVVAEGRVLMAISRQVLSWPAAVCCRLLADG